MTTEKQPTPAVWIILSIALMLFSGSVIALPLAIASLVFALRMRKILQAEPTEASPAAARFCRNRCILFLSLGLIAALISGAAGIAALLYKYAGFRL